MNTLTQTIELDSQPLTVKQLGHKSIHRDMGLISQGVIGFPVKSRARPGVVLKHHASIDLPRAIFVIGDDDSSRQWLQQNHDKLKQLDALGLMTNVDEPSKLYRLAQAYDLSIIPEDIDTLLKILGLNAYPFLYYQGEITQ